MLRRVNGGGAMDSFADFVAEALRCEQKAASTRSKAAHDLLLSTARRWRVLAEAAAEREVGSPTGLYRGLESAALRG
jgi:hypothetical protein